MGWLDTDGLTYLWSIVKDGLSKKVDVVSGKGLSTNDYTNADKQKLAAFSDASAYALKSDITEAVRYKGSKDKVSNLPSSGNKLGDMWNVVENDMNYIWDGKKWDPSGSTFTVTPITTAEIDAIVAK